MKNQIKTVTCKSRGKNSISMKSSDNTLSFTPINPMKQLMGLSSKDFNYKQLFMTRKCSL